MASSRGIEAARAFVRIYAEDQQLKKSLQTIGGQFKQLDKMLSGRAFMASMAALGAAGGGVLKVAMDAERVATSFEVMIGSAQRAQAVLAQIDELARTSPFGVTNFQQAGQVLLNFGMEAQQLLPTLSMLGDIAAGDSEKLQRMTLVFGQMTAAGRLMGQDLLQMINAGFNPLQQISEQTGESMAELKKRMEQGAISSAEVTQAFRAATSEGGRFFNMTERLAKTTGGVYTTMRGEISLLAREMGNVLLPAATMALNVMRGMVAAMKATPRLFVYAGVAVVSFVAAIKAATIAFMAYSKAAAVAQALTGPKGWAAVATGVIAATAAVAALSSVQRDLAQSAGEVHEQLNTMPGLMRDVAGGGAQAAQAAGQMGSSLYDLKRQATAARDPIAGIRSEVEQFRKDLEGKLGPSWLASGAADSFVAAILEQKTGFADMFREMTDQVAILGGQATETSLALDKMAEAGVSPERLQELRELIAERDRLQKQQEGREFWERQKEEMTRSAQDVQRAVESVQVSFRREQSRLQSLVNQGLLSQSDADAFLRQNPDFARLMSGQALADSLQSQTQAQDLRTVSGAAQLTSIINRQGEVEERQLTVLQQVREVQKRLVTVTEKGLVAWEV